MSLFKFIIYDKHEKQSFDEVGNLVTNPFDDWKTFHFYIDTRETRIVSFRSYVLFDEDNNPLECTKVWLDDGSFIFAKNKVETFEANYKEIYLPLISNNTNV